MNLTVVRYRCWGIVLAVLVGWMTLGQPQSVSLAQDGQWPVAKDDHTKPGADGIAWQAKTAPESFVAGMIRASSIFGFLILLVAFTMIAIILMIAVQLRRDNYLPATFIEDFEQQLQAKDYQGAYESAKGSDSFIGRILTAGMGRLSRGYGEAVEQMQQAGEYETMAMEQKIGYLALIGSIAPMLGLLGTVQGMLVSFQVIASSASPKPSELADGISTALFTTFEGLVVAIPAMIFYALFKNRLARFLMECGFVAENLMKNFQNPGQPELPATVGRVGGAAPAKASVAMRAE